MRTEQLLVEDSLLLLGVVVRKGRKNREERRTKRCRGLRRGDGGRQFLGQFSSGLRAPEI